MPDSRILKSFAARKLFAGTGRSRAVYASEARLHVQATSSGSVVPEATAWRLDHVLSRVWG